MITIGSPEQFQTLREFLRVRYSDEIVAAALGVASVRDFEQRPPGAPIRDILVRVLFGGAAVGSAELRAAVPGAVGDAMVRLGLLESDGDRIWCPVVIYPLGSLHLISDRFMNPDGTERTGEREFVYFALTGNTRRFLDTLPDRRCSAFLDIGAGCGAAALAQSDVADAVVASDISPRSCLFSTFNGLLNGVENFQVFEGSLYEPVRGMRFDRIGCHPPYDLSSSTPWTFADGGEDGEFVIRGAVEGLVEHLEPGGEFVSQFRAADYVNRPLEWRIREWLGEARQEFDIAFVERSVTSIQDYALASVMSTTRDLGLYESYLHRYEEQGVEQLSYGSLLIRRRADSGEPLTLRRRIGKRCTYEELRWLLDWERAAAGLDLNAAIVVPSPDMEIVVRHRSSGGELHPVEYKVTSSAPFSGELQCPQWIALLISEFNGSRTTAEVYAAMRQNGTLEFEQFTAAVRRLIGLGVLQLASGSMITSSI